jgi:hypothetical protein
LTITTPVTSSTATGLSVNENSPTFISKYFGTTPTATSNLSAYVYAVFPDVMSQIGTFASMSVETASLDLSTQYTNASTPWIKSQPIAGTKYDLFKV